MVKHGTTLWESFRLEMLVQIDLYTFHYRRLICIWLLLIYNKLLVILEISSDEAATWGHFELLIWQLLLVVILTLVIANCLILLVRWHVQHDIIAQLTPAAALGAINVCSRYSWNEGFTAFLGNKKPETMWTLDTATYRGDSSLALLHQGSLGVLLTLFKLWVVMLMNQATTR